MQSGFLFVTAQEMLSDLAIFLEVFLLAFLVCLVPRSFLVEKGVDLSGAPFLFIEESFVPFLDLVPGVGNGDRRPRADFGEAPR